MLKSLAKVQKVMTYLMILMCAQAECLTLSLLPYNAKK